jgi:hypothetical protein
VKHRTPASLVWMLLVFEEEQLKASYTGGE